VFESFIHKCKEYVQNDDFFDPKRRLYMSTEAYQKGVLAIKSVEQESIFKICLDLVQNISQTLCK